MSPYVFLLRARSSRLRAAGTMLPPSCRAPTATRWAVGFPTHPRLLLSLPLSLSPSTRRSTQISTSIQQQFGHKRADHHRPLASKPPDLASSIPPSPLDCLHPLLHIRAIPPSPLPLPTYTPHLSHCKVLQGLLSCDRTWMRGRVTSTRLTTMPCAQCPSEHHTRVEVCRGRWSGR